MPPVRAPSVPLAMTFPTDSIRYLMYSRCLSSHDSSLKLSFQTDRCNGEPCIDLMSLPQTSNHKLSIDNPKICISKIGILRTGMLNHGYQMLVERDSDRVLLHVQTNREKAKRGKWVLKLEAASMTILYPYALALYFA